MTIPFWRYLFVEFFKNGNRHRYYLEGPAPVVWFAVFMALITDRSGYYCTLCQWTHVRPKDFESHHEVLLLGADQPLTGKEVEEYFS